MGGERLKHGLARRRRLVEPLQRLAPPGEADAADRPVGAGGEDRGERDVKTPQRVDRGPPRSRDIGESEAAVGVEVEAQRYITFFAAATTSSALSKAIFSRFAA